MRDHDPIAETVTDQNDLAAELDELGMTGAELDAALEAQPSTPNLDRVWEPDEHMVARVTARVENRIADRQALFAVVELLGLGWFTLQSLFSDHNEGP